MGCLLCTYLRWMTKLQALYSKLKMADLGGSQLFSPFRALGFVTNQVPLAVQTQGQESLVATAVGSSFHVYNVSKCRKI